MQTIKPTLCLGILFTLLLRTGECVMKDPQGVDADGFIPLPRGWVLSKRLSKDSEAHIQRRVTPPSFHPPFVEFHNQPLCEPKQEEVVLVNADPRHDLHLYSMGSQSSDFHCTWPRESVVPPGKNTSFSILYLGLELGRIEAQIRLNTSHGNLAYEVFAESVRHPLRTRPVISSNVPAGIPFVQALSVYNPLNVPLRILEVFSSDKKIQLDLSMQTVAEPKVRPFSWILQPLETRTVVFVRVDGSDPGVIEGYINLRTNSTSQDAIIALRLTITDESGLYFGPGDMLDFGLVSMSQPSLSLPVEVLSNTDTVLKVTGAKIVEVQDNAYSMTDDNPPVNFELHRVQGLMTPNTYIKIGRLNLMPHRDLQPGIFSGKAKILYLLGDTRKELIIPFRYEVLQGTLDYSLPLQSVFFRDKESKKTSRRANVTVLNNYDHDVALHNVTIASDVGNIFKIKGVPEKIIGAKSKTTITIVYDSRSLLPKRSKPTLRSDLLIAHNASARPFNVPIFIYDGHLIFEAEGSVRSKDGWTVQFGDTLIDEENTKILILKNLNPIQISLRHVSHVKKNIAKLLKVEPLDGEPELLRIASGSLPPRKNNTRASQQLSPRGLRPARGRDISVTLKPGHAVYFAVSVKATSEGKQSADLHFETRYEDLSVKLLYNGLKRVAKLSPEVLSFPPSLPARKMHGRVGSIEMQKFRIKKLFITPELNGARVERVYSEDPRFFVRPATLTAEDWNNVGNLVELATVVFKPSMGNESLDYIPVVSEEYMESFPPLNEAVLTEVQRADKVWRDLKRHKIINISSYILVDSTDAKRISIAVNASLQKLTVSSKSNLELPLTQIKQVSEAQLVLINTCKFPVKVALESLDTYAEKPKQLAMLSNLFHLSSEDVRMAEVSKEVFDIPTNAATIPPNGNVTFTISYKPETVGASATTILVRSNLSIVEPVSVTAEAGRGTFGFPKSQPCIIDGGLSFPIQAEDLLYCKNPLGIQPADLNKTFTYNVSIVNRGNMPVSVSRMSVNGVGCELHGFRIHNCDPFMLMPKTPHMMTVDFKPDFTSYLVKHKLIVQLEGSARPLNFLMQATLPQDATRQCWNALPSRDTDFRFKATVLVSMVFIGCLIIFVEHQSGTWHQYKTKTKKVDVKPNAQPKSPIKLPEENQTQDEPKSPLKAGTNKKKKKEDVMKRNIEKTINAPLEIKVKAVEKGKIKKEAENVEKIKAVVEKKETVKATENEKEKGRKDMQKPKDKKDKKAQNSPTLKKKDIIVKGHIQVEQKGTESLSNTKTKQKELTTKENETSHKKEIQEKVEEKKVENKKPELTKPVTPENISDKADVQSDSSFSSESSASSKSQQSWNQSTVKTASTKPDTPKRKGLPEAKDAANLIKVAQEMADAKAQASSAAAKNHTSLPPSISNSPLMSGSTPEQTGQFQHSINPDNTKLGDSRPGILGPAIPSFSTPSWGMSNAPGASSMDAFAAPLAPLTLSPQHTTTPPRPPPGFQRPLIGDWPNSSNPSFNPHQVQESQSETLIPPSWSATPYNSHTSWDNNTNSSWTKPVEPPTSLGNMFNRNSTGNESNPQAQHGLWSGGATRSNNTSPQLPGRDAVAPAIFATDGANIWSGGLTNVLGDLDWVTKPDEVDLDVNAPSWQPGENKKGTNW
eukprot:m.26084 g.26084  ORF g.26084 m.26084 type:complete len:1651 (+) comp7767_c0_seq1:118-5070(+)